MLLEQVSCQISYVEIEIGRGYSLNCTGNDVEPFNNLIGEIFKCSRFSAIISRSAPTMLELLRLWDDGQRSSVAELRRVLDREGMTFDVPKTEIEPGPKRLKGDYGLQFIH